MDLDGIDLILENWFGDSPYGIEDLDPLRAMTFVIGVPPIATARFKRYVFAAGQTVQLGNKSVDHMLKANSSVWTFKDGQEELAAIISRLCTEIKHDTQRSFMRLHRFHKPSHGGLFAGWAAMLRLHATIRSLVYTVRHGFHFESAALLRLFLEQLAWVASIRTFDDLDLVFAQQPTQSIKALKRLFPGAGWLYGYLTDKAHITPEQTKRYVQARDDTMSATFAEPEFARHDSLAFLYLADWYQVLCELIVAPFLPPSQILARTAEGDWAPNPERSSLAKVKKYHDQLYPDSDDPNVAV